MCNSAGYCCADGRCDRDQFKSKSVIKSVIVVSWDSAWYKLKTVRRLITFKIVQKGVI
jgi:hypothetical protein